MLDARKMLQKGLDATKGAVKGAAEVVGEGVEAAVDTTKKAYQGAATVATQIAKGGSPVTPPPKPSPKALGTGYTRKTAETVVTRNDKLNEAAKD